MKILETVVEQPEIKHLTFRKLEPEELTVDLQFSSEMRTELIIRNGKGKEFLVRGQHWFGCDAERLPYNTVPEFVISSKVFKDDAYAYGRRTSQTEWLRIVYANAIVNWCNPKVSFSRDEFEQACIELRINSWNVHATIPLRLLAGFVKKHGK